MSEIPPQSPDTDTNNLIVLHAPCRVAYTLNNAQPVACSIISDQPMFYIDTEEDFLEDDEFMEDAELALLEREVTALKKEIEEIERFSSFYEKDDHKKMICLAETITEMTVFETQEEKEASEYYKDPYKAQDLRDILCQSRLGQAYFQLLDTYNVSFEVTDQVSTSDYNKTSQSILIGANLNLEDALLLSAQELRRHWQHRQGALINPLNFHPDNAILIHRIQMADLSVAMVRIAWELQLAGNKDVWDRLESSSMADLAYAFAKEAFIDFRTIQSGAAATAVFEAWFMSDRCRSFDRDLIQKMLSDYQCTVLDIDRVLNSVSGEIISALGSMPFGKNYLARHAGTIMSDPIFTDVRDRSSANFLWFIKFERSFKETEQGLQTSMAPSGRTSARGPLNSQNRSPDNEHEHSAQIISLFPEGGNAQHRNYTANRHSSTGKTADIVAFQRWSPE